MKYQHTAKGLASLGRNGDDVLMHVNKDELAGLQALLGPVTVNPETGLPEAFNWSSVLSSVGIGLLGALTGGAAAPALGAIGATAVGAGTGALAGGALSAAQGKGFAPGALGGAISGGMGGFGGAGLGGTSTTAAAEAPIGSQLSSGLSQAAESAVPKITATPTGLVDVAPTSTGLSPGTGGAINKMFPTYTPAGMPQQLPAPTGIFSDINAATPKISAVPNQTGLQTTAPTPQSSFSTAPGTPSYWDALKKQGSTMMTKDGLIDLAKPVGMGAMVGSMVQSGMEQDKANQQQQQAYNQQQQANAQDQQNYMSSLGFPLPTSTAYNSPDTATQRNYFTNLVYPTTGMAAGGPVTASRTVLGIPVQTTFPAKYVDQFEQSDLQKELPEAFQGIQQLAGNVGLAAEKSAMRGMANGGYLDNTVPTPPGGMYPQSLIPQAQPKPGATPVRQEVLNNYAEGGSVYEKGGFLDGPGDGMSDDIPANIDGQEEVRLADGEFVIPPEIVNMLGYGDPEKGAALLDKLLPLVRQAAHGKKEQVKQDAAKGVVEKALMGGLPKKKSLAAEKAEARKARG